MTIKHESFVFYYQQFKNKIYAYFLYRIGFDRKLAEDLTSEVFLKAFKKFDDFQGGRPFQPWIFAISRNHLINHYKSSKREVPLTEVENYLKAADPGVENKQEVERAMAAINRMEEGERDVLLLRFVNGLTNAEIAGVLEKAEGAVRTQISRCLHKLRHSLKDNI